MSRQCTNCGTKLTQEMYVCKMCFVCGEEIHLDQSDVLTILQRNNNKISFNTVDNNKFISNQYDITTLLSKKLENEKNTHEICLKNINSLFDSKYLATLKNNTELFNKAFENLELMTQVEKGERFFLFCSRETYNATYGINSLISNGFFITSKRILFRKDKHFTSLPMKDINSLAVDTVSDLWYLNESEDFIVSSRWCNAEELSLIFAFIFTIARDEIVVSKEKKKTMEISKETPHQEKTIVTSPREKLREVKKLYEDDLISESEYLALKEKILKDFI